MTDFQDRGESHRQRLGIDGTAGDAQDEDHPYIADVPHGDWCVVCGLAPSYRRHRPHQGAGGVMTEIEGTTEETSGRFAPLPPFDPNKVRVSTPQGRRRLRWVLADLRCIVGGHRPRYGPDHPYRSQARGLPESNWCERCRRVIEKEPARSRAPEETT